MARIWRVASYEYRRHVFRRRFLIAIFSLPALLLMFVIVAFVLIRTEVDNQPVGYIDDAGVISKKSDIAGSNLIPLQVQFIPFSQEVEAAQALQDGQIQAYFIVQPDYLESTDVRLISRSNPSQLSVSQFATLLRTNLLASQSPEIVKRLTEGDHIIYRSFDAKRQFRQNDWLSFLLPFAIVFTFMFAMLSTAGYLLQAVVEEKQNKTMEILISSISPTQLMVGKILGILAIGATQLLAWFGLGILFLIVLALQTDIFAGFHLPLELLLLAIGSFIPAFVIIAAMMVAAGATITEPSEAQQVTSLFTLPLMIPIWFSLQIINNPDGLLAVFMSLFPLTAPVTLALRSSVASVPGWQIGISLSLLVISALIALWFAGRAFRQGMLRYGQRVRLGELLGRAKKAHL